MLLFLAPLLAPVPGPCGAPAAPALEAACLAGEVGRADAELTRVETEIPGAIDSYWDGDGRNEDDRSRWIAAVRDVVRLWRGFRDSRCDARLAGYEAGRQDTAAVASARCRLRITQVAANDLAIRYGVSQQGPGRADVETMARLPAMPPAEDAGPCDHVPPRECDYCGINRCYQQRLKRDDAQLNAAWRRALARIAAARGLSAAERADWAARLRASQRLWLRWRDADCDLERLETPNPNAHSIYSLVTGPCLTRETEARTAFLARAYGR